MFAASEQWCLTIENQMCKKYSGVKNEIRPCQGASIVLSLPSDNGKNDTQNYPLYGFIKFKSTTHYIDGYRKSTIAVFFYYGKETLFFDLFSQDFIEHFVIRELFQIT